MGLDVTVAVAVEEFIGGEVTNLDAAGEGERHILSLLRRIGDPDVLRAARELEALVARSGDPQLEDLAGDIWSMVEILQHLPGLIAMVVELFAARGRPPGPLGTQAEQSWLTPRAGREAGGPWLPCQYHSPCVFAMRVDPWRSPSMLGRNV